MSKLQPIIVIDTREQAPWTFECFGVQTEIMGLRSGDYSVRGFETEIGIERKSLDDLVNTLIQGRERFEKELLRAKDYPFFCVIFEGSWEDIAQGRYFSKASPQSIMQSMMAFTARYGIPFIPGDNRERAEYIAYSLLEKYLHNVEGRMKRAKTMSETKYCNNPECGGPFFRKRKPNGELEDAKRWKERKFCCPACNARNEQIKAGE